MGTVYIQGWGVPGEGLQLKLTAPLRAGLSENNKEISVHKAGAGIQGELAA